MMQAVDTWLYSMRALHMNPQLKHAKPLETANHMPEAGQAQVQLQQDCMSVLCKRTTPHRRTLKMRTIQCSLVNASSMCSSFTALSPARARVCVRVRVCWLWGTCHAAGQDLRS